MNKKIVLSTSEFGDSELHYIEQAIARGEISNFGENLNQFENDLEQYLKSDVHVACLSSGTAAIHLALVQLGIGVNDEVLCQTFTFCGSANPIKYVGAKPIFIDSETETWNMCPEHLEAAIKDRMALGNKPKAIVMVHIYGMPSKIDALLKVANHYDIPVIEDAAEALGSAYKGKKCGTFGEYAIFSFNGNKIITTSGGGALMCRSEKEKTRAIFYATQARDKAPYYEHTKIGYNYRMSNLVAGMGRGQMEVLDKHVAQKRQINSFYKELFKNKPSISLLEAPNSDYRSNFWLNCITIDESASFTAEELRLEMDKAQIETRPLWKPMHLQSIYKNYPYYGNRLSEKLFKTGLCLPSGSNMTPEDFERISGVFKGFI